MYVLFLLLVLPLLAVVAIILGAIWMSNTIASQVIGKKHHLLEEIVNTGEVPQSWTSSRMPWFLQDAKAQERRHKRLLRKLDDLIQYVRTTSLVADEESRDVLLARLFEVRADWEVQEGTHAANHQVTISDEPV
jgi:hypothetical protein